MYIVKVQPGQNEKGIVAGGLSKPHWNCLTSDTNKNTSPAYY